MATSTRRRRTIPPAAATSNLYSEYALDRVFTALTSFPDYDVQLQKTGITRAGLRQLEGDDEIASALDTRRDALGGTHWRLEPGVGRNVTWIWEELEPWIGVIKRGAWQALPYGYSVMEMIYRRDVGGRVGIERVFEKPVEWFQPTPTAELIYLGPNGTASDDKKLDTRFKFFLTQRNATYRNPYGEALLSRLYWAWFFRHNTWRYWMQFLERFGMPLILGTSGSPAKFVAEVQKLGINSVIGVGQQDKVEAIHAAVPGEFERADSALSRRIQKLVLGQTLTSDMQGGGSYAAASVHDRVRDDKRVSDIRLVQPTCQHIVDALWVLNKFPGVPPTFVLADDKGLEAERAKRDRDLYQSGVRFTEQYLLRTYDFEAGDISVVSEPAPTIEEPETEEEQDEPRQPIGDKTEAQAIMERIEAAAARLETPQPVVEPQPDPLRAAELALTEKIIKELLL